MSKKELIISLLRKKIDHMIWDPPYVFTVNERIVWQDKYDRIQNYINQYE